MLIAKDELRVWIVKSNNNLSGDLLITFGRMLLILMYDTKEGNHSQPAVHNILY
jgi:hypothetical protein